MTEGERVRIVDGEFAGRRAMVVQDQTFRVFVLIDGTNNPVPFRAEQLRRSR